MAQVLQPYNGQLSQNEIFSALYNMIISQEVIGDPIKGTYGSLAEKFKREGGLFGDSKLFYSVQIGNVDDWANDSEAANLLALNRPAAPNCQAVKVDKFKKIWLTVDNFLSKRAFGDEGVFAQFNSVILATIRDTKRVYEATMMNAFIGTETAGATYGTSQNKTVTLTGTGDAQKIGEAVANILIDVEDVGVDYNDLAYVRSYDKGDMVFVWNSKYYNQVTKLDLPGIFHNDGIIEKLGENVLPARYFGTVITATNKGTYSDSTPTTGKPIDSDNAQYTPGTNHANGCIRFRVPTKISTTYYKAGDEFPAGTAVTNYLGNIYIEDANVICKIIHKDAVQYLNGFETETEFWNPRSLTTNHYLIFGHSDLTKSRLVEYPFITLKKA